MRKIILFFGLTLLTSGLIIGVVSDIAESSYTRTELTLHDNVGDTRREYMRCLQGAPQDAHTSVIVASVGGGIYSVKCVTTWEN